LASVPADDRYVNVSVRTPACAADAVTAAAAATVATARRIARVLPSGRIF
jgi:hypothetical protein